MSMRRTRSVCWRAIWNDSRVGMEHLLLRPRSADSAVLSLSETGVPFRLAYSLAWDDGWRLQKACFHAGSHRFERTLNLSTDGSGKWRDDRDRPIPKLDGCTYLDIWPTPFTNTFPILCERMGVGERRELRMAWVFAPALTVKPQAQAYTRLADRTYLFESLDGTGFKARLTVDAAGLVIDYPGLFKRVPTADR